MKRKLELLLIWCEEGFINRHTHGQGTMLCHSNFLILEPWLRVRFYKSMYAYCTIINYI